MASYNDADAQYWYAAQAMHLAGALAQLLPPVPVAKPLVPVAAPAGLPVVVPVAKPLLASLYPPLLVAEPLLLAPPAQFAYCAHSV